MNHKITAAEISQRLSERTEAVCQRLLPNGRIVKKHWLAGNVQGDAGDSLQVSLDGRNAGKWKDWATNEHGDLIDLWRLTGNLSPGDAFREVKAYLGISDGVTPGVLKAYSKPPVVATPSPTENGLAFKYLTETRKLLPETITAFKVGVINREIVFPSYSPAGTLVNRSYRTLPKEGEKKGFRQDKDCAPSLFGWHVLPAIAYKTSTVLIAEGQIDAMTWHQWGIPALSIPAGSDQSWINYDWDNLAMFDKILIAFDCDESGEKNAASTIKRLGAHRCYRVTYPHKDANEALQAGKTALDAQQWVSDAKAPSLNGVVTAHDLATRLQAEIMDKEMPTTIPFFERGWENEAGFYFRPGEVTLWTGTTGNGKSTFLCWLTMTLAKYKHRTFMASMEVRAEASLRRMAVSFWGEGGTTKDKVTAEQYMGWLGKYGDYLSFADRVGFIEADELFDYMEFAFRRYGSTHFIIDSLMRIAGLEENYPAQGEFMARLARFADDTGAHVHLVAHPRKMIAGQRAGTMDVKGSGLISNNADNVVGIARNFEKWELEKEGNTPPETLRAMHDTEITVEKQRESGWTGTFYLDFNHRCLTYKESTGRAQSKPKQKP